MNNNTTKAPGNPGQTVRAGFHGVARIVRVISLAGFVAEVPPGPMTNGNTPVVRISNIRMEGEHSATFTLNAQAVNAAGEIVWLAEVRRAGWLYGQPFGKDAESIYAGMGELERIAHDWFAAQGYDVREGDYGLPSDIKALAAQFECARWLKDEDAGTYRVEVVV